MEKHPEPSELTALIDEVGELGTLPTTVIQLLELLDDPTLGANRVLAIVEKDPAMTANLLKLSNSAYYSARHKVGSVREALVLLGNKMVATLALATSMVPILRRDLTAYGLSRDQFWFHSQLTAAGSALVCKELGARDLRHQVFTAGLIHDLGKLIIDGWLAARNRTLDERAHFGQTQLWELQALGFDHGQAGAHLAEVWGFPPLLIESIRKHHDSCLKTDSGQAVRSVAAGNILALSATERPGPEMPPELLELAPALELAPEVLLRIRQELQGNPEHVVLAAIGRAG